jgi:spore coat polysaccharide biosynthesis protein SpsF (cytidylyltransferase family)
VPEPTEYENLIYYHLQSDNDFSSNIYNFMGNGYPDGIGVEIFSFNSLQYIWENINDPYHREHIATNYYDYINNKPANHTNFKIGTINCRPEISRPDLILDVNTAEEYDFIRQLYDYLYPKNPMFSIIDVINWFDTIYNKRRNVI